jgi:hypothetical protein
MKVAQGAEGGENMKLFTNGNKKIGSDTITFNMTAAMRCPADKAGLCPLSKVCYAKKSERQYPSVVAHREYQAKFWEETSVGGFITAFEKYCGKKLKSGKIKYMRFSESGDFRCQADVERVSEIANILHERYNIITYLYTHRRDLDFTNRCKWLIVNGSGFMIDNEFRTVKTLSGSNATCKGNCRECNLCKMHGNKVIEVLLH